MSTALTQTTQTTETDTRAAMLLQAADDLRLTDLQRRFALEYVQHRNGTRAAIAAGFAPSSAAVTASKMLRFPKIQTYLDSIADIVARAKDHDKAQAHAHRKIANAEETLELVTARARVDMADFITVTGEGPNQSFYVDLQRAIRNGKSRLIKKLEHDKETGAPRIELVDAAGDIDRLTKFHRLFEERPAAPSTVNIMNVFASLPSDAVSTLLRAVNAQPDVIDAEVTK